MQLISFFLVFSLSCCVNGEPFFPGMEYLGKRLQRSFLTDDVTPESMREEVGDFHEQLADSLAETVLQGVIGMTADAVSDFMGIPPPSLPPPRSHGGCRWFGHSPFCLETCPSDYDFIKDSSGRCADNSTEQCIPDPSFGQVCTSIFGFEMKKKFCCKSDPVDCTWSGRWMGAQDAFNFYCRYDSTVGRCGLLHCSVNHRNYKASNSSMIGGDQCDELSMWNLSGKATCGYIAWSEKENGTVTNSWYKTQ